MREKLLILLWLLLPLRLCANSGHLYPSVQLSSGLINGICQDKYGYIWTATEYGLNRFDGYRFTKYLHIREDSTSLNDNEVVSLFVDKTGTLWVGTAKGLQYYEYETNRFRRYHFPDDREPRVASIQESKNGRLLIATAGYGLYSIGPERTHIDYESTFNQHQDDFFYHLMYLDREEGVWRSNHRNDITRFDTNGSRPQHRGIYTSPYGQPISFIDYSPKTLLVVCLHGILQYNYRERQLTDGGFDLNGETSLSTAFLDSRGDLYLGTRGNGLFVIPKGDKQLRRVENTNSNLDLSHCDISTLAEDRSGNLWAGCYNKGLLCMSHLPEAFRSWSFTKQNYRTGGSTSSIVAADDGGIWCSVMPGDLYKMDANGQIVAHKEAPRGMRTLYRDSEGRYWAGTDHALYRYLPASGNWIKVREFVGAGIETMLDDGQGNLYVSIFGAGLGIYDTRKDTWHMLTMQQTDSPDGYLTNNWVKAMLIDSQGALWIATASGVSMLMLPKTGTTDEQQPRYVFNAKGWNALLEGSMCNALCETADGNILVSANDELYIYYRKTNKLELLPHSEQLKERMIGAMVRSQNGDIWISTTMGIWQYSKDGKQLIGHISGNGLNSSEYVAGAVLHTADDRIYFGTPDGVTTFKPSEVTTQNAPGGKVQLTGITVNNRAMNPLQNHFDLRYNENTLTLEFSLLDFSNPENISYEWRINGSDHWQQTEEGNNRIMLTEMQPGSYQLEVRASYNGLQSEETCIVKLNISQPWYKTPLAWLLYFLIAATMIGLVLFNFERQRRRDLEETKMQFLINATHDIRSPLTLIMGAVGKLKKESHAELQQPIETIDKNAQRLLLLVNQILDERKIDKGQMRLACEDTDLGNFVYNIYKLYGFNARQRNITYIYNKPEETIRAWIDHTHFDKVVSNLLSNAFKYTPDGGSIAIDLSQTEADIQLRVTDSGRGFDDDNTERFFKRFYQGKNAKDLHIDGTGIGLNLSRAITELHGGTITATNRKDGVPGAILTVTLKKGNAHLKPEQIEHTTREDKEKKGDVVPRTQGNRNLHILLTDDDPEIAQYITSELGRWYHFDYASNGREALKRLLSNRSYALVISDVMMPEMDGITLLRSIKQNPQISDIPVIMLTSKSEVNYRLDGIRQGADAYIAKPFSMEELHVVIDNLIDNVRRLRGKFSGAVEQKNKVKQVDVKGNDDILMDKIMKSINAHLSDPELTMELLTKEIGISRAQLHRKMKELTGLSTTEFIRNLRLEQAARLIKEKKVNVTQVAYSVGFNNQAHFSTTFKKHFGMSPTEYANQPEKEMKE
ncbi:MAG: response regulator [Prevotella sp.]|nr:response regulator [Prevotella sp.]